MADIFTKEQRSYIMSRIRGKNTKPEILVRKFLFAHGFRYRCNSRSLPGSPDIVIKKVKAVVFIHGCFWHGHRNCNDYKLPKTHTEFWRNKIEANRKRDKIKRKKLKELGWAVIEIYQCELKERKQERTMINLLLRLYSLE